MGLLLFAKESTCQGRSHKRCGFDPQVWKIPWRRKWQPFLVFLPGKSYGQRSLEDYSPLGNKELDTTEQLGTDPWMPGQKALNASEQVYFQEENLFSMYFIEFAAMGDLSVLNSCLFSYQDIIKHSFIWRGNSRMNILALDKFVS